MADADTKIADLKTEPAKGREVEPAKPASEPEKPVDKSEGAKDEKRHPLDDLIAQVEDAPNPRASVHLLVEKLGDEFASPELQERADKFADAATANAHQSYREGLLRAPAPATEEDVAALEARNHAAPHNDAAAAAVDAGMDVKTANEMTKIGSNI